MKKHFEFIKTFVTFGTAIACCMLYLNVFSINDISHDKDIGFNQQLIYDIRNKLDQYIKQIENTKGNLESIKKDIEWIKYYIKEILKKKGI